LAKQNPHEIMKISYRVKFAEASKWQPHTLSHTNQSNNNYTNPVKHGKKIRIILLIMRMKVTMLNHAVSPHSHT